MYKKRGISDLVRWLVNSNGNYRALSFNENRRQNNRQSPSERFNGKEEARKDSFIKEDDLVHWLHLSHENNRLTDSTEDGKQKVDHFVTATFKRINNIYHDCYHVITETANATQ